MNSQIKLASLLTKQHAPVHETLAAARCAHMEAIDNVYIATADETLCVANLHDRT